ncbi:MAG: hypothetical protein LBQ80_05450 [Clostridium sp.]|jgi:hypothetical protein|nr:hypothetical protein [Clostridium sp.]
MRTFLATTAGKLVAALLAVSVVGIASAAAYFGIRNGTPTQESTTAGSTQTQSTTTTTATTTAATTTATTTTTTTTTTTAATTTKLAPTTTTAATTTTLAPTTTTAAQTTTAKPTATKKVTTTAKPTTTAKAASVAGRKGEKTGSESDSPGATVISMQQLAYKGSGKGVRYKMVFKVTDGEILHIYVGDNIISKSTDTSLFEGRYCKITVDDKESVEVPYTFLRVSTDYDPTIVGRFKYPLEKPIKKGSTVTIEVSQQLSSSSDRLEPEICIYSMANPTTDHLTLLYGGSYGPAEYRDTPFYPK